jgi:hypothetical protein
MGKNILLLQGLSVEDIKEELHAFGSCSSSAIACCCTGGEKI